MFDDKGDSSESPFVVLPSRILARLPTGLVVAYTAVMSLRPNLPREALLALGLAVSFAVGGCRSSVGASRADLAPANPTLKWSTGSGTPEAQQRAALPLVFLPTQNVLAGFGGTPVTAQGVWSYSLASNTWAKMPVGSALPAGRTGLCAAYLPTQDRVLFVGGHNDAGPMSPTAILFAPSTSTFADVPSAGPPPANGCAAAYLPKVNGAVVVGASADTWLFDGSKGTFSSITAAHSPSARHDAAMVYDAGTTATSGRLLLFGGTTATSESAELWAFDGADWAELGTNGDPLAQDSDDPRPMSRARAAIAIDTNRRLLYVFGGLRMGQYLNDLWRLDLRTSAWEKLALGVGPTGRADASVAYDPSGDRILVFGGIGASGMLSDGWVLAPAR